MTHGGPGLVGERDYEAGIVRGEVVARFAQALAQQALLVADLLELGRERAQETVMAALS